MNRRFCRFLTTAFLAFAAWVVTPTIVHAAQYRTCVKWQIETDDSGAAIQFGGNAGGTEDHYVNANSGTWASAVGVRVRVVRNTPGFDKTFDTETTTGCLNWSDNAGPYQYVVTAYAYQRNNHGSYVRMHDSAGNCTSDPGSTYGTALVGYTPTSSGTDVLYFGNGLPWVTGQAMLGYSQYRFHSHHGGGGDFAYHVYRDTVAGCSDVSNVLDYTAHTHTAHRHCLALSDCATRRRIDDKFVVAHEMGHAVGDLHYAMDTSGTSGIEPFDSGWPGPTANNARCLNAATYDQTDVEYNVVGFREGFANFYSARVFNDRHPEGMFNFLGIHDLERYDRGLGANGGGELENICCNSSACRNGHGVISDWMRFFWDWYTNVSASCPTQPDGDDMLDLYMFTRLEGGLQKDNLFSKMEDGVQHLNLPACLINQRFDAYAAWNGIDNE